MTFIPIFIGNCLVIISTNIKNENRQYTYIQKYIVYSLHTAENSFIIVYKFSSVHPGCTGRPGISFNQKQLLLTELYFMIVVCEHLPVGAR